MQLGGAPRGTPASVLCVQTASLSRPEKSLALASVQRNSGISAAARHKRRFFGPCGGAARQDVSAATDVEVNPSCTPEDEKTKGKENGAAGAKKQVDNLRGAGATHNPANQKTVRRN